MPLLILQHESFEHAGHFTSVLPPHRISCLGEPAHIDECRQHNVSDGITIMGGPMSANDALPGLRAELDLIERALKRGTPLLGICLGSQLIAKALGARVYANPEPEIGWAPVHLTDAGRADPLFREIPSPSTFFHWHSETFDLPAGAEWLAYSDKCRHQAYRFSRNVYGIQFHPEITPAMIDDWCRQPVNCGDVARLDSPIDPHAADPGPIARNILKLWLELI
jgi:GMP synthase (glutamine-hydrolysing)